MHRRILTPWFFALLLGPLATAARAAERPPVFSHVDGDTYTVMVHAGNKFTRNTDALKALAIDEATKYCVKEGKAFQFVSVAENKSMYLVGDFANVVVTFRALPAGTLAPAGPEAATADPATRPVAPLTPVTPPAPVTPVDILYSELTKLGELRKQGLLTDEEFAEEKRKAIARSK
jgi:hypothetical protein